MIAQVVAVAVLLCLAHAGAIGLGGIGLGLGGGIGSGLAIGGLGGGIGIGGQSIDLYAPPKYEYRYAVADGHTGDLKEQAESRIGDLTKNEYATGEKDRETRVSRIIAGGKAIGLGAY